MAERGWVALVKHLARRVRWLGMVASVKQLAKLQRLPDQVPLALRTSRPTGR